MNRILSMLPRASDPQFLGRAPSADVHVLLQAAARTNDPGKAEALLREALILDPYCLDTYLGFCRLYIREERTSDAENAALAALSMAAHSAGLASDWRQQQRVNYQWAKPAPAERYYLAALEVLGAVRLIQGNRSEHQAIIQKLAELGVTVKSRSAIQTPASRPRSDAASAPFAMAPAFIGA